MISQKKKIQIAHAYGFKHKGMFLKLLEDKGVELPSSKLLDQDTQIDLFARIGISKRIAEKDIKVAAVAVEKYCKKRGLPPPYIIIN
jgi:hypothetical protein